MRPAVKPSGRSLAATSVTGQQPQGCLFYIRDRSSSLCFLVDTGAQVSIVPPTSSDRAAKQRDSPLQAINGTNIPTFGVRSLTLDIGLRRTFRWVFVIADIPRPVLGADFLYHFNLLVDLRLMQGIVCRDNETTGIARLPVDSSNPYTRLLSEFSSVTQPCSSENPVKHTVTHHIVTTGPAVFGRTRRLAPERLHIARQEFDHMLQLGIIRPSSSSWASHPHMVPKRTLGDWRPCGDF